MKLAMFRFTLPNKTPEASYATWHMSPSRRRNFRLQAQF